MPRYDYQCNRCEKRQDLTVPFIERHRQTCECGGKLDMIWTQFPGVQPDWKPYVDYADPSGTFPMRVGGRYEYRELVKRRAEKGLVPVPDGTGAPKAR